MKTLISFVVLSVFVLTSSFTIDAQQKINTHSKAFNCFDYLRLHRQGKGISVNWSVSDPSIVSFVVERSYDELNYEPAGAVNFTGSSSYKILDNNVSAGFITYRVIAVKSDGSTECSPIEKVRIVQRG
jgi:hypothetical protein